jgi:hypothetical protein
LSSRGRGGHDQSHAHGRLSCAVHACCAVRRHWQGEVRGRVLSTTNLQLRHVGSFEPTRQTWCSELYFEKFFAPTPFVHCIPPRASPLLSRRALNAQSCTPAAGCHIGDRSNAGGAIGAPHDRIRSTAYDSCAAAHFPRHLFRTSPIVSSCRCEHTTRASRRSAVATGVCHAQTSRWFESPKGYYLLNIRVASDFGEQVASEQRQQMIRVLASCAVTP